MKFLGLILGVFLAGCASLLSSNTNINYYYVLNPIGEVIDVKHPAPIRLSVLRPIIPGWLDTQNIMLRRAQNQVDFYAEARWVEKAGDMLGRLIAQSLENNDVARDIHYSDDEMHSNYVLETEIIAFQADYAQVHIDEDEEHPPPVIEFALQGKLISMPDRKLHSSFTINNTVLARQNRLREIIKAFDAAVEESMVELVHYTAQDLNLELRNQGEFD